MTNQTYNQIADEMIEFSDSELNSHYCRRVNGYQLVLSKSKMS